MNRRFFGWLAAATVALTFSCALSASAQTQDGEEHKSVNAQQSSGEHNLLAMASVPVAATSEPAAAPPSGGSGSFNWTGFYVGGHFGRGMGHANMKVDPLPSAAQFVNLSTQSLHTDPSGKLGGIQGGFNLQRGPVVYGIESDYSFSDMNGTKVISPIVQNNGTPFPGTGTGTANSTISHQDTDWIGTLRLRVGVTPVSRLLLYGTGGLAYGHVTYFALTDFTPVGTERYPAFADKTRGGWCAGTGAEFGIQSHFTARFEYLFYDLGTEIRTANPIPPLPPFGIRYTWATQGQIVRGGFNFKF